MENITAPARLVRPDGKIIHLDYDYPIAGPLPEEVDDFLNEGPNILQVIKRKVRLWRYKLKAFFYLVFRKMYCEHRYISKAEHHVYHEDTSRTEIIVDMSCSKCGKKITLHYNGKEEQLHNS